MKKTVLFFILLFIIEGLSFAGNGEPNPQQAALLDSFGDDVAGMTALTEDELIVFVQYGNYIQSLTANEILNNRRKRAQLENQLYTLLYEKDRLSDNDVYSQALKQSYENQIEELRAEIDDFNQAEADNLQVRNQQLKALNDSAFGKTEGDPVKITRGSYEQNEIDFSLGNKLPLTIDRYYDSQNSVYSSFGYGWSTNLDERLILGTEPDAEITYTKTNAILKKIDSLIKNLNDKILTEYEIKSIDTGKEQITALFDSILSEVSSLSSQASSYGFYDIVKNADSLVQEFNNIREKYLSHFSIDQKYFNQVKLLYNQLYQENLKTKKRAEESAQRRRQNKKALFKGMDSNFDGTGLNTIILIDDQNYPHILYETEADTWQNQKDRAILECRKTSDGYTVTFTDGNEKLYDSNGFIIQITDRNQNTINITRSADEKIQSAQTGSGEKLIFTYEGAYISKITNARASEQTSLYSYKDGRLVTFTDTDGDPIRMEYDSKGRLTKIIKCDDSQVQFIYGQITKDKLALTTQTINEENHSEYFIYDLDGKCTIYKDHDQEESITYYDDRQRTIKEISKDGKLNTYKYDDEDNLVESLVDGEKIAFSYDQRGNKSLALYEDASYEEFSYDSYNLLIYYRDRDGVIQEFIRDSRGNIIEYKCGGARVLTLSLDSRGNVIKSIVYCDKPIVTEYQYDSFGNCRSQKNAGVCYSYEYDNQNRITKISLDNKILTTYRYLPKKIIKTDYNGLESTFISNGRKDITDIIQKDIITGIIHTMRFEYDRRHLPVKIYAGDGKEEILLKEYNYTPEGILISQNSKQEETIDDRIFRSSAGRLSQKQSPWGGLYNYEYDAAGLLKSFGKENMDGSKFTWFPDGSVKTKTDVFGISTSYSYDQAGNLVREENPSAVTYYEYDKLGRIIKAGITEKPGAEIYSISYQYSEDNRTVTVLEGNKYKTINELDAFGNIVRKTDGLGNSREYKYDFLNHLIEAYDAYKNKTSYEYNELGLVKSISLPQGQKTEYEYDQEGRLLKITDACGSLYMAEYNDKGQIIKEKKRSQAPRNYEYDDDGQINKILCNGQLIEAYAYEEHGTRLTISDAMGNSYIYKLDSFGQLVSEENRLGLTQSFVCDPEGNLINQEDFNGFQTRVSWSDNHNICTTYYQDGSRSSLVYNAIGNISQAENDFSNTLYEYDTGGRLILQKDLAEGEEIRFEYDAAGNRTKLSGRDRESIYSYGANNELKFFFDNKQRVSVQLQYNKNGWEILRKFGNGTTIQTSYDQAGRTSLKCQKNSYGEILWGEAYIYGQDGKRTATVDNRARVTLYEYDSQGRLSAVYYPYTAEHEEALKEEAGMNGLSTNGSAAINRYLSTQEKAALSSRLNEMHYSLASSLTTMQLFIKEAYSYDKNGNRIAKTSPLGKIEYSYDKENRLLSSGSKGQAYVTYTYDKAGNLLSQESGTRSIKYTYNSQNRMIYSEMTDKAKEEYSQTSYSYDAFGRRILARNYDGSEQRALYDSFTFELISQKGVKADTRVQTGGERYRYISEQFPDQLSQFSINGSIAAQASTEGIIYYAGDLLDSIRCETDINGSHLATRSYDAFGSLVEGDFSGRSNLGYLGKEAEASNLLYNYGYRDYNPATARFTTSDPIRDGTNWFTYCNNDPVNFVDLWGDKVRDQGNLVQQSSDKPLANSDTSIYDSGCVLTAYVRIAQALTDKKITLDDANKFAYDNGLFTNGNELSVENGVKLINELIKDTGKKVAYAGSLTGSTTEIAKQINQLETSELDYFLTARIETTNDTGTETYEHTVSINSNSVFANDITDMENSLNIRVNDTSWAYRQSIENDKRKNKILRVDLFILKEK